MPMLKTLVYNLGVRVVSTSEGLDSEQQGWELLATILAIVAEQYIKDLAQSVFRGQEGAVLAGYSVGDHCFGYTSVPIPGSELGRRGRDAKPRKTYALDAETAVWVARIFHWFVQERRTLRWIARELNRLGAPKDHRATSPHWRHQYLPRLLTNRKYIGDWQWGLRKNVRDPNTGKVSQRRRAPEDSEQWRRHLPQLAIVDHESFELAQQYLEENRAKHAPHRGSNGQLAGSAPGNNRKSPRHLLAGLVQCAHCGGRFVVGGTRGKYLHCPGYLQGTCGCQTQLNRQRAEEFVLAEIGRRILENPRWTQAVVEEATASFEREQHRAPAELATAEKSLADVTRKISRLVDVIEDGQADADVTARLAQRRQEKRHLESRIEHMRRKRETALPRPDQAWVEERLASLACVLADDAPAASLTLQHLLSGPIVVTEIRRAGRQRHYLQGKLQIVLSDVLTQVTGGAPVLQDTEPGDTPFVEEITIDFVEPDPLDALSEQAKTLYDQRMLMVDIARQLKKSKSMVTKLIQHWHQSRGLVPPDGRARRGELVQKHQQPPLYQQVADDVMRLYDERLLLGDIATQLRIDRNTVTAAVTYWHESRGLAIPDGRTRRKTLPR